MPEDKAAEAPLIAAIRTFANQVADGFHAATRRMEASVTALAVRFVLILAATAVSACLGIAFLARGLHTILELLSGSAWIADIAAGILMIGLPVLASTVVKRQAHAPAAEKPSPPPHRPAS